MGNAQVFAQSLSQALGRPVSVQEAQMIQNSPEMMKAVTGAVGSNIETTGTQKDADAATAAWAAANPKATEQQKADYKANLIAGGMGGSDLGQRQYLAREGATASTTDSRFPDMEVQARPLRGRAGNQAKKRRNSRTRLHQDYTSLNTKTDELSRRYIDTLNQGPRVGQGGSGVVPADDG